LVIVRVGQAKAGFVVDELHGENQTVIKPLGKLFENLKGIGGATVLGSGDVALILDVHGLIQFAQQRVPSSLLH
jgi:two-component system, chemotaxis family, sensor kinase CheA